MLAYRSKAKYSILWHSSIQNNGYSMYTVLFTTEAVIHRRGSYSSRIASSAVDKMMRG